MQLLEVRKGKDMHFPLESLEGMQVYLHRFYPIETDFRHQTFGTVR